MRLAVIALVACSSSVKPAETPADNGSGSNTAPLPFEINYGEAEKMAWLRAKPVFQEHCARCHVRGRSRATNESLDMFDMSKYPFAGKRAPIIGDAVRDVLGQSGMASTMPKDRKGSVRGDDLALILAWSDAWARARKSVIVEPN